MNRKEYIESLRRDIISHSRAAASLTYSGEHTDVIEILQTISNTMWVALYRFDKEEANRHCEKCKELKKRCWCGYTK